MTEWLEYITSDENTPMANLRRQNGREEPWDLPYIGVGNESWGCGGEMTPEFYADLYRQYSGYCRLYSPKGTKRVASGANSWDTIWTDVVMGNSGAHRMEAISVHYYTVAGSEWNDKGPATGFGEDRYMAGISKGLKMDQLINNHIAMMDKHDPRKRVDLYVDEWGIWTNVMPGTEPGHLFQQNTMRDALIASTTLDIFHRHTDRVKMANIAQLINVLQAMILTSGDTMVLTPTYHVFNMYKGHMDNTLIPVEYESPLYIYKNDTVPVIHNTISKNKDGKIFMTVSNLDPRNAQSVEIPFGKLNMKKVKGSKIITTEKFDNCNTFKNPELIKQIDFDGYEFKKGVLSIELPPMSIVSVELE